jgi:hypothetical protein
MSPDPSMSGHEVYAEWDAAYVLGALSSADRRDFEEHLRSCEECTENVAALAGIPGLLARIPRNDGLALLDAPTPPSVHEKVPATLLPRLELAVHRDRRRRRAGTWALVAGAAAAGVIGALTVPPLLNQPAESVTAELEAVDDIPLTAGIELTSAGAGTQIDMWCNYPYGTGDGQEHGYDLYVIDAAGEEQRVSTWWSRAGQSVDITATVGIATDDIEIVEVRSTDDGKVLLTTTLE